MKKNVSTLVILFMLLAVTSSCSKDNDLNPDSYPENTVTLNLTNDGTVHFGIDVVMTKGNNFSAEKTFMTEAGKGSSVGKIRKPNLITLTSELAVQPGKVYLFIPRHIVVDVSPGVRKIKEGSGYIQLYVNKFIKENDKIVGAVVTYGIVRVKAKEDIDDYSFQYE